MSSTDDNPSVVVAAADLAAFEAERLAKIHGTDQRSAELVFRHAALGAGEAGRILLKQQGADSKGFVPGTSTIIWPCAYSLGDFLCDASEAFRHGRGGEGTSASDAAALGAITPETVVVELGAGLGLGGLVAAGLGAKHVEITDATPEAARQNLDVSGYTNARVSELYWRRAGWRRKNNQPTTCGSRGDATLSDESGVEEEDDDVPNADDAVAPLIASLPDGQRPHLILGSDVCYSQSRGEMQMLVDTIAALAEPGKLLTHTQSWHRPYPDASTHAMQRDPLFTSS